ncbi:MAG TPA: hypothetical protein VFN56_04835 [Candidatus Saccharimonadales bacterium]|nr:hypothetical protein [Candidatus Saccharimonadales bacterium]
MTERFDLRNMPADGKEAEWAALMPPVVPMPDYTEAKTSALIRQTPTASESMQQKAAEAAIQASLDQQPRL